MSHDNAPLSGNLPEKFNEFQHGHEAYLAIEVPSRDFLNYYNNYLKEHNVDTKKNPTTIYKTERKGSYIVLYICIYLGEPSDTQKTYEEFFEDFKTKHDFGHLRIERQKSWQIF